MQHYIERLSLIQAAQQTLKSQHLLIESAAGYGKSILLAQLLTYLPQAVYLRLTIDDDDIAVLRQRLKEAEGQTVLLDDIHLLTRNGEAAQWLGEQFNHKVARFVMAGRFAPFELGQTNVKQWRESELAFTSEIVQHLLDSNEQDTLAPLNGWPLGVALLRQLPPGKRRLAHIQDEVFQYLAQTVFDELPEAEQAFLCVTAVPQIFTVAMAVHLLNSTLEEVNKQLEKIDERNLFLFSEPDGYRYHDLFRGFLKDQLPAEECMHITQMAILYLEDQYENEKSSPEATELALEAGHFETAAKLIHNVDHGFLNEHFRYRTTERWLLTLPEKTRVKNPGLYWLVGYALQFVDKREDDAFAYLKQAETLSLAQGNLEILIAARYEMCAIDYDSNGASDRLVKQLTKATQNELVSNQLAITVVRAYRTQMAVLSDLGRFKTARTIWQQAIQVAQEWELGETTYAMMKRQYALYVLIPLGEFQEAQQIYIQAKATVSNDKGSLVEVLSNYCDLLVAMGDWQTLETTLSQINLLMAEMESNSGYTTVWVAYYKAWLAISRANLTVVEAYLSEMKADTHAVTLFSSKIGAIRLSREKNDFHKIKDHLAGIESNLQDAPYHGAQTRLEADVAYGLEAIRNNRAYTISPASLKLYRFHARGDILRLRVLAIILRYKQGNARWRQMANLVLRDLERPHYLQLLNQRDSELGAYFWCLMLIEGIAIQEACASLNKIALIDPLVQLLQHDLPEVRQQAAEILAEVGNEQGMAPIIEAIRLEGDESVKQVFQTALDQLETLPPPHLHLQLLGEFAVQRGEQLVTDFHRPIVARLLQYFAIRHGQPVSRDRILEDLWPETPPEKSRTTFKTVYSRLRNTLEPFMRSKGPNRYFLLSGDSYTFDPDGYVTVDIEEFQTAATAALESPSPWTNELMQQVKQLQPILPDLPYADWLMEPRERIQETALQASLAIGQQALAHGDFADAQQWGQAIIQTAPWMEAAYQLLMRAYDRQNQRGNALRTYENAKTSLQKELDVETSSLTQWLYQRLQDGESI